MIPLWTTENSHEGSELCRDHMCQRNLCLSGIINGHEPVGMAVDSRWRAMSSPSCVCNAGVGVKDLRCIRLGLLNEGPQFCNLANLLVCEDLVPLVAVDC